MALAPPHPFGCDPNCWGSLSVDGFSLNTWGWMIENVSALWFGETHTGGNRRLPRQTGTVGYPRYLDEHEFSLVMWVTGATNSAGTPNSDWFVGLAANLATLRSNLIAPVTSGDGSRPCVLTMPNASTRTANVQFEPLSRTQQIDTPRLAEFVLRGTIISGRFS